MGAEESRALAKRFGLKGRVDLYHAFVSAIGKSLRSDGVAGIIVSNRFMTTRSGQGVRSVFANEFCVHGVWDFGDTKLFDAAVLPAVIVASGTQLPNSDNIKFSSVYESSSPTTAVSPVGKADGVFPAMLNNDHSCEIDISDGRRLSVQHGRLDAGEDSSQVWRLATAESDEWLATVAKNTWKSFGDIGAIRVGVKTCADKVFIRDDWDSLEKLDRPELLKRLTTHHVARPFRAKHAPDSKRPKRILYPHRAIRQNSPKKKVAVDLDKFPKAKAYLLSHAKELRSRKYVAKAGREWFEIWVPQDPSQWKKTKLVFRDIAAKPCFWIDKTGSVVNGDCYWLTSDADSEDLLWLAAAVGNSTFIEQFYDHRFRNKLYAGRRRFLTQYVQEFPLPKPALKRSRKIVDLARSIHADPENKATPARIEKADQLVWKSFGLCKNAR